MPDEHDMSQATSAWRRGALLAGFLLLAMTVLVWRSERRSEALREEVRSLRTRLTDRRELITRQRQEMAEVATAVDRLAQTAAGLRERSVQVRRLAHMEEARDPDADLFDVAARFDGGSSIVSEDGSRALGELTWLEGETATAGDSLAVLIALLKEPADSVRAVPTLWPVRGSVTSPFGTRMSPYGEGPEMHAGIDISARYGFPVAAAGSGEVLFAGRDAGYGGLVVIDHGGKLDTLYGHLSAFYVREGQKVRRGQPIGAVGDTGRATGTHLHYEVRVNGASVDPRRYLVD